MSDLREVLTTVECRTTYSAYVKMTEDEFNPYDKRIDDSDKRVDEDVFMTFIDCQNHWLDDGDYEVVDFTMQSKDKQND